jgi:hypothetical protein
MALLSTGMILPLNCGKLLSVLCCLPVHFTVPPLMKQLAAQSFVNICAHGLSVFVLTARSRDLLEKLMVIQ